MYTSRSVVLPFLFFVLLTFSFCNRIKRKGHEAARNVKQNVSERKEDFSDKIIAHYDPYHSDTKFNKKRFTEFFYFAPGADVTNIYCFADEMGIDHSYQFAFNCNLITADRIISNLQLKKNGTGEAHSPAITHDFPWWDIKQSTETAFSKKGDHETYRFLWYDTLKQKAYYIEFDM